MMAERGWNPNVEISSNCPRCGSCKTKFCYYNNYRLTQPRYFCEGCRRYWTNGGSLRNVPVGGGFRKSRSGKSIRISTSSVPSKVFPETQGSSSSSISIDIAQVFANYLTQQPHKTEMRVRGSTPQSTNDSYFDQFSSASPYMQMDFNSYFTLQMGCETIHHYTNIDHVVDDLPPLPGEEGLQVSTTGWEDEIVVQNTPQLASIEPEVLHSEDHLIFGSKSLFDMSSYDTFFRS